MRKFPLLALLVVVTSLLLPQTGRAQDEVLLGALEVDLWPEYDQPDMLVIYKVTLQPESPPVPLTFRIPKVVGDPVVAIRDPEDGNLYEISYTQVVGSEWLEISFQVNTAMFQLEYYDRLPRQGLARQYKYVWPGDYDVISAAIITQQPSEASDMQFSGSVASFMGEDKLIYYAHQIGTLSKGQAYDFSLSYEKSTHTLTADKQKARPADKLPESMWNRGLPWALGVLALALIGGGVYVYWRSGQPHRGDKKPRRRKTASRADGEAGEADSGVYCHRCGRRAALNDVFCRSCGTKLRV